MDIVAPASACTKCGHAEEWRPVLGHEGTYEISTIGRVRSLGVRRRCGYGKIRFIEGRMMASSRIALSRPGEQRYVMREVLFLEHFARTPMGAVATYVDADRDHLCVNNIGWEFPALGYRAMHHKVERALGKGHIFPCVDCGKTGSSEWSYTNSGYCEVTDERGRRFSLDPAEYQPRCRSCHRLFDGAGLGRPKRGGRWIAKQSSVVA